VAEADGFLEMLVDSWESIRSSLTLLILSNCNGSEAELAHSP
jgi:hypothetical protein